MVEVLAAEALVDAVPVAPVVVDLVARAVAVLEDKTAKAQLRWEAALLHLVLMKMSRLNQKSFLNLDSGLTKS